MTVYYLQVLVPQLSIELDSDVNYHHHYQVGDIIQVHMYSDKGPKVCLGGVYEYDAQFTYQWDSLKSKRLTISSAITGKYLSDITNMVHRDEKLKQLGI